MTMKNTYTGSDGPMLTPDMVVEQTIVEKNRAAHLDPLTGAPGMHPIGTGVGAFGAGAAGAVIGAALGPAGSVLGGVVGAVVGAFAGGLAGHGAAEAANPTDQDAFWQENYKARPYYTPGSTYEDYMADYRFGYEAAGRFANKPYPNVEVELRRDWEANPFNTSRSWDVARHAVRDAYDRVVGQWEDDYFA